MGLHREHDDPEVYTDFPMEIDEGGKGLSHKRLVRKMLDDRLERKRLREEFDELDGEFDWEDFDR